MPRRDRRRAARRRACSSSRASSGARSSSTAHDTLLGARASSSSRTRSATSWRPTCCIVEPDTLLVRGGRGPARQRRTARRSWSTTTARCVGILTRTNVARGIRRRVVLVDHNETSQSAAGHRGRDGGRDRRPPPRRRRRRPPARSSSSTCRSARRRRSSRRATSSSASRSRRRSPGVLLAARAHRHRAAQVADDDRHRPRDRASGSPRSREVDPMEFGHGDVPRALGGRRVLGRERRARRPEGVPRRATRSLAIAQDETVDLGRRAGARRRDPRRDGRASRAARATTSSC